MQRNKSIIEKADMAVSDLTSGGLLMPEQADRFVEIIIAQPTILAEARIVRMGGPKRYIDKMGFGSRILRAAPSSGSALSSSERSKPDLGKVELSTKELIAEVRIPYDVLEDNIEKANFEDTLLTQIAKRTALDLEEWALLADTDSLDTFLALTDGILELVPAANQVDGSAITSVTKEIFKQAVMHLPAQYAREIQAMRHYVSHQVETEYRDVLADRASALGDEKVVGRTPCYAFGAPVIPCALMPNPKLLLVHPKNILFGIQRDISIETDRDITTRSLIVVVTIRCDIKLEQPEAAVLVSGFRDASIDTTTTTSTTTTTTTTTV
jgi:HK97 family phage major capsid protein